MGVPDGYNIWANICWEVMLTPGMERLTSPCYKNIDFKEQWFWITVDFIPNSNKFTISIEKSSSSRENVYLMTNCLEQQMNGLFKGWGSCRAMTNELELKVRYEKFTISPPSWVNVSYHHLIPVTISVQIFLKPDNTDKILSKFDSVLYMAFKTLKDRNILTDINLLVSHHRIPVHRIILAGKSKIFSKLISQDKKQEIVIDDLDITTVQNVVDFLYSGALEELSSIKKVLEMLRAAKLYEIKDLKEACYGYIERNVSLQTVANILTFDESSIRDDRLKIIESSFISQNKKILQSKEYKTFLGKYD